MHAEPTWPLLIALLCGAMSACSRPSQRARETPLSCDAYVWQRRWSAQLGEAVEQAPAAIRGLRVLALERSGAQRVPVAVAVDVAALARSGREVVAVFRIDGTAPLDGVAVDEIAEVAHAWRRQGVRVRGLEIDHDCATAALPAYAAWLGRARARQDDLALSITALPTWLASPALPALLANVAEAVVQLHAIAAPVLFDPGQARSFAEAWSRVAGRAFRVALPTYRARLRDGTRLAADPASVAGFLADLRKRPIPGLSGVAWFRLGHAGDADAWAAPTLAAVMHGTPLAADIAARLVDGGSGAFDVVVENRGSLDGDMPGILSLRGDIDVLDGVRGLVAHGSSLVAATPTRLRAGERAVVGYVRGKGIHVAVP
jgi:hypothetical protein